MPPTLPETGPRNRRRRLLHETIWQLPMPAAASCTQGQARPIVASAVCSSRELYLCCMTFLTVASAIVYRHTRRWRRTVADLGEANLLQSLPLVCGRLSRAGFEAACLTTLQNCSSMCLAERILVFSLSLPLFLSLSLSVSLSRSLTGGEAGRPSCSGPLNVRRVRQASISMCHRLVSDAPLYCVGCGVVKSQRRDETREPRSQACSAFSSGSSSG